MNREQKENISNIFENGFVILSFLFFSNAFIPLLQGAEEGSVVLKGSDPVSFVLQNGIYLVTSFLLFRMKSQAFRFASKERLIWLLLAIALISPMWSELPFVTLRKGMVVCATTLFGLYLGARYSIGEQLRLLSWTMWLVVICSLFFVVLLPHYGITTELHSGAWRGIYSQKNVLARMMVLGSLVFLIIKLHGFGKWVFPEIGILVCIAILVMTRSMSAVVILAALVVLIPFYRLCRLHPYLLLVFILMLVAGAGILEFFPTLNFESLLEGMDRDTTLTGRTELWELVLLKISQRPWLGYGFGSFWHEQSTESKFVISLAGWNAQHSHNGYLDLLLSLGVLGLTVFVVSLLNALRKCFSFLRTSVGIAGVWFATYLLFMVNYNITESTIIKENSIFWVLYVSVLFSVADKYSQLTKSANG